MKSVFLSSVSQGFKRYRDAAHDAINKMDGYHCRRMEQFGPRDCDPAEFCKKEVAKCDLFVGLVGLRYGSCPPGSDKSFSELEYDAAIALNKPTLMIGMSDEFPVPGNLIESDTQREKQ